MRKLKNKTPQIVFKPLKFKDNLSLVNWAFFETDETLNLHNATIGLFPELKEVSLSAPKNETYRIINKVVKNHYKTCKQSIKYCQQNYKKIWQEYNDKFFTQLCSALNCEWPKSKNKIVCNIGVIPVFPRFLDRFSFSVSMNISDKKLIETCAHESLHFLWFEKWKTLFKDYKKEEFESPNLVWRYSEMVVDPILNTPTFKNILNTQTLSYDSFYNLTYKNKNVMQELINIYNKKGNIEGKIKNGFKYIQKVFK